MLVLATVFACLFVVNGALLIFRPDLFLRLYDLLNPGDFVGKTAEWRKNVHNTGFKLLGVGFVAVGLLFLRLMAKLLLEK
jgi:hypothetical protein